MKSILLLISLLFAGQKAEAQYGYNELILTFNISIN